MKKVRVSSANNLLRYSLGYILDFYKICVSPYINSECSYVETCSSFSKRMILEKGVIFGLFLTFLRLISCTLSPLTFHLKKIRKNKIFLLSFPVISILFVSCMSFSYEGGWSNIVYSESDDSYLVTTSKGKLHKFKLSDGFPNVEWTYPEESKNTSYSDPIIFEKSVISSTFSCRGNSCEGEIFQLDLQSGDLQWKINTNTKISSKIAIKDNVLAYATLKKQTEVSNNKEAEIHFIELSDNTYDFLGKITLEGEIWTGIYLFDEKFVISTLDGWVYILDANISLSEEITLENITIDSRKFPYSINSPIAYSNNRLFFSDVSGTFYSADVSNLSSSISSDIGNWMVSSPIFEGTKIYIFTVNGDFLILDSQNLELLQNFSTEKIIVGSPTITSYDKNEYILIPTEKKGIEVISNKELDFAESQGSYPTDKKIYSSPLVNKNNLLIHTQDGQILFFRLKSRDLFYCLDLNERKICD